MNALNILVIDAGNTRVKWGVFNNHGDLLQSDVFLNTELAASLLPQVSRVIISNVAGKEIETYLKKLLPENASIRWITSRLCECNVINHYMQPESLGTDRWAALIAAWHIKKSPCIVVCAGTAVTIDGLSVSLSDGNMYQGNFMGGLILPGLNLMHQSLGLATAQLPKNSTPYIKHQHTDIFAKNTADAIHAGALFAVVGAITLMEKKLGKLCKKLPHIIICGGNANIIKESLTIELKNQALIVDNLILQGLYLIENFIGTTQK